MRLPPRAGKGICSRALSTVIPDSCLSRYVVRVRFGETDLMGIAHHASYLMWFEAGRVEYMHRRGVDYLAWTARGVHLPVIEAGLRYRRTVGFDERIVVETRLGELRRVRVRFDYRLLRESDGELVAEGFTTLACVDDNHKPRRIPEDVEQILLGPETAPREIDRV